MLKKYRTLKNIIMNFLEEKVHNVCRNTDEEPSFSSLNQPLKEEIVQIDEDKK